MTEIAGPEKPKIFSIWHFPEKLLSKPTKKVKNIIIMEGRTVASPERGSGLGPGWGVEGGCLEAGSVLGWRLQRCSCHS